MAVDLSSCRSPIFEEARAHACAEALVETGAQNILIVFEVRGIDVPEAVRERITSCGDPKIMRQWHRRAVVVPVAEAIFATE